MARAKRRMRALSQRGWNFRDEVVDVSAPAAGVRDSCGGGSRRRTRNALWVQKAVDLANFGAPLLFQDSVFSGAWKPANGPR